MALKNEILKILLDGKFVSGQRLAEKFSVSRNAVWKAVRSLKEDGFSIDSDLVKGYRLYEETQKLSASAIAAYLSEVNSPMVYVFEEIDSTNNEAKRRLALGNMETALFVSNCQTNGRGRMGRTFYSPKSTGVYMSLSVSRYVPATDAVTITSAAAVAVAETIEALSGKSPMIKWVNDIYLDGKKICGILTEAVSDVETSSILSIIVGIGINLNTADFPDELALVAGSLNAEISPNKLVAMITEKLLHYLSDLSDLSYMESYRLHSLVIGQPITYTKNGRSYDAIATGIDDRGALLVTDSNGNKSVLSSGEISLKLKK